jgi:AcrR family transcriptional regulator
MACTVFDEPPNSPAIRRRTRAREARGARSSTPARRSPDGGFEALSIRRLSTRCGYAAPTIYHYFRDKPAIVAPFEERRRLPPRCEGRGAGVARCRRPRAVRRVRALRTRASAHTGCSPPVIPRGEAGRVRRGARAARAAHHELEVRSPARLLGRLLARGVRASRSGVARNDRTDISGRICSTRRSMPLRGLGVSATEDAGAPSGSQCMPRPSLAAACCCSPPLPGADEQTAAPPPPVEVVVEGSASSSDPGHRGSDPREEVPSPRGAGLSKLHVDGARDARAAAARDRSRTPAAELDARRARGGRGGVRRPEAPDRACAQAKIASDAQPTASRRCAGQSA